MDALPKRASEGARNANREHQNTTDTTHSQGERDIEITSTLNRKCNIYGRENNGLPLCNSTEHDKVDKMPPEEISGIEKSASEQCDNYPVEFPISRSLHTVDGKESHCYCSNYPDITTKENTRHNAKVQKQLHTKHITQEVTDAMLTVAAAHRVLEDMNVATLRVMLHSRCSGQADFNRSQRGQYYDSDMEEMKLMKVQLPGQGVRPYPTINIRLTLPSRSAWRLREGFTYEEVKEGEDMLSPRGCEPMHRSEQLVDFPLVSKVGSPSLVCRLDVDFFYTDKVVKHHLINVDVPIKGASTRKPSLLADPLNEAFKAISSKIGGYFGQLAVHLGIEDQERHEIERIYPVAFDRNYALLRQWRRSSSDPTLRRLVSVLSECNRNDLVKVVEEYVTQQVSNNHPAPRPKQENSLSVSREGQRVNTKPQEEEQVSLLGDKGI